MKALQLPDIAANSRLTYGHSDHFVVLEDHTGGYWTNEGSVALAASRAGVVDMDTGTSDNDFAALKGAEVFDLRDGKPLEFEAWVTAVDSDTANKMSGFIGVSSTADIDTQIADGGTLVADWHGAGFFWLEDVATLGCISSVGTTNTTTVLTANDKNNLFRQAIAWSSSAQRKFKIDVRCDGSGLLLVVFKLDGVTVCRHRVEPASSPTVMGELIGIKTHAAEEKGILPDYSHCFQAV